MPFVIFRGDHLRSTSGITCGPIWGSFPVWGSFAVGDHLRRCTVQSCFARLFSLRHKTWWPRIRGVAKDWERDVVTRSPENAEGRGYCVLAFKRSKIIFFFRKSPEGEATALKKKQTKSKVEPKKVSSSHFVETNYLGHYRRCLIALRRKSFGYYPRTTCYSAK